MPFAAVLPINSEEAKPGPVVAANASISGIVTAASDKAFSTSPRSRSEWLHLAVVGVLLQAGYLGGVWSAVKAGMGAGTAALVVTRTDGRKRTIFFDKGKATGADLSQADGNMEFRATKEADLYRIQAGNERYEIPEAAIFGG
mgnify:CR=1 FL=1